MRRKRIIPTTRAFGARARGAALALGVAALVGAWFAREPLAYRLDLLLHPERAAIERELVALTREDPAAALDRLAEILATNPLSRNTCHGVAHQMGHEAFEAFGFAEAMSYQNGICGSGYAHGVVEARFGLLRGGDLAAAAKDACGERPRESCAHGVGHGLMVASGLDVPSALGWCETMPAAVVADCFDGVFMHALDPEEGGAPKDVERYAAAPAALCAGQPGARGASCAFYLPRAFGNERLPEAAAACASLPANLRPACEAGVGHAAMKGSVADPAAGLARCDALFGDSPSRDACAEGGLEYLVFEAFAEAAANEAGICDRFSGRDRRVCDRVAGEFRE